MVFLCTIRVCPIANVFWVRKNWAPTSEPPALTGMPRYFFNLAPGQPTDEEDEELPYDAAAIELARQTVADMSRDGPFTIPEECVIVSKEDGSIVAEVYLEELGIAPEVVPLAEQPPQLPGQSVELLAAYRASAAECQNNADKAATQRPKRRG